MRLKILLGILLLSFSVLVAFTVYNHAHKVEVGLTAADAQEVYDNLLQYTGLPGNIPPLFVIDDPQVNAFMSPVGLVVTTGILHFVKDKDELAAVIGHEMGHFVLGHLRGELTDDSRIHEENCDKFGIYLLMRAGYNPCEAKNLWVRMGHSFGDDILTDDHPSPSQRAYALDFPMCEIF